MKQFSLLLLLCLVLAQLAFQSAMDADSVEQPSLKRRRSLSSHSRSGSQGSLLGEPESSSFEAFTDPDTSFVSTLTRTPVMYASSHSSGALPEASARESLQQLSHKHKSSSGLNSFLLFAEKHILIMVPFIELYYIMKDRNISRAGSFGFSIVLSAIYVLVKRSEIASISAMFHQFILTLSMLHLGYIANIIVRSDGAYYWTYINLSTLFISGCMFFDYVSYGHKLTNERVLEFYATVGITVILIRMMLY